MSLAVDMVRQALKDPRYKKRSIAGITEDTGLLPETVEDALGELRDAGEIKFTSRPAGTTGTFLIFLV